jgi:hypothetical protein
MQQFKQSESTATRRRFYLHLVDATDGYTPETGEAGGQPQISKNGASFNNTSATLVAISNGAYYVELTEAELDSLGTILVRYKSANTTEFQDVAYVIAYNPYDSTTLGLSTISGIDANVDTGLSSIDSLDTKVTVVSANVDTINSAVSAIDTMVTNVEEIVELLKDAHWNKRVLTKISDTEYKDELYNDDGSVVIRTHTLTKSGDVETRQ